MKLPRFWKFSPETHYQFKHSRKIIFLFSLMCLFFFGWIIFLAYFSPKQTQAAWLNDNWGYRNNFPLTSVTGGTNKYINVTIDTATLITAGKMSADCSDIRFTDQGGNLLDYFIVSGCNTATTSVDVQYKSLQSADQPIYFYYGNAQAVSRAAAADFSSAGTATVGSVGTEEKAPSPTLYYKFDEGSGITANNSGQPIQDVPTFVQSKMVAETTGKVSTTTTFDSTPTPGNLVVVTMAISNALDSGGTDVVTDNQTGNTYTRILAKNIASDAGANAVELYYAKNVNSTGTFTVTCNPQGTVIITCAIFEYSGVDTSSPLDQTNFKQATTATTATIISTNTVTTTTSSELYFAAMTHGSGNDTVNQTDGTWTERQRNTNGSNSMPTFTADKVVAPGTYSESWQDTTTGGVGYAALIASFKPTLLAGTLLNGPTKQTEDMCISGKCLWFDGSNDQVKTTDNNALDFAAAANFTVSAWVKHSGPISSAQYIVTKEDPSTTTDTFGGYKVWMDGSGNFCFGIDDDNVWTPDDSACSSGRRYDDNQWHFVQGVKEGTAAIRVYVDGILAGSDTSIAATGTLANPCSLYIGTDLTSSTAASCGGTLTNANYWSGFIDDVKIYRDQTIRTAAQAKADFNSRGVIVEGNNFSTSAQNNPNALSNGLVGYWKEDEASNANATDSSGVGTTLTDTNTVARAAGKFFNGADFESGNSEYQFAADNATLSIAGSLTLAAWIKPESVTAATLFDIAGKWDGANESYLLAQFGTELRCYIDAAGNYVESTNASLATGTWYHTACVYDASKQTAKIYVNGVEKTTTTTGTIPASIGDDAGRFQIGAEDSTTTAANFYDGVLDDIRVYSRNLSPADINNLYNFAVGPVGQWDFEEGAGTTANDTSSNANTGTITAGTGGFFPGKFGKSYKFDKATTKIDAGSGANLDDLKNGAGLTAEAWINPISVGESASNGGVIIGKATGPSNTPANGWFLLLTSSNAIKFTSDGSTDLVRTTDTTTGNVVTLNTWNHVAVTWDGSVTAANVHIYINGVEANSYATSTDGVSLTSDATPTLIIGNDSTQADTFDGFIDNVKVYNYPRSQKQAVEDMNAGHPAPGSPVGSPVGWWKFNEGADNTCSGGTNDACNSGNGGNGLDAAQSNMAVPGTSTSGWTQAGKFGRALNFDNSDDVLNAGSGTAIDNLTANPMTLSAWILPNTMGESSQGVIMAKNSGATPSSGWLLQFAGTNALKFSVDGSTDLVRTTANNKITTGVWNYITLTWDGTFTDASTVHIYVNGIETTYQTTTNGATRVSDAASSLFIGNDSSGASTFDGTIDEVKIFTGALTANQVKIDMNNSQSQQLGAAGNSSTYQTGAANQEYCVPGDTSTCLAPQGRWDFEEGTGTAANDTSGNGNTGTLSASTTLPTWKSGKIGKAIADFDVGNGKVDAGSGTSIDDLVDQGNGGMTITAWVYDSAPSGNFDEIISKDASTTPTLGFTFGIDNNAFPGAIDFEQDFSGGTNTNLERTSSNSSITFNTWQFVALTYDGSTSASNVHIYVNGKETSYQTTTNGNSTRATDAAQTLKIGQDFAAASSFHGKIDQVRVFNYIRTPAQIAYDYNRGAPVAWWKLDDCQGTTANDSSGNSNSGTVTLGAGGTTTVGTCTTSSSFWGGSGGTGAGKRNYAPTFDGTDDYIDLGATTNLRITGNLTLAAWIKLNSDYSSAQTIFSNTSGGGSSGNYLFEFGRTDNKLTFINDASVNATSTRSISDNNWHHVVITRSGVSTSWTLKFYIDGLLDSTTTGVSDDPGAAPGSAAIGRAGSFNGNYFKGQIDDARIYNYPLTGTQVGQVMNNGAINIAPATGAP